MTPKLQSQAASGPNGIPVVTEKKGPVELRLGVPPNVLSPGEPLVLIITVSNRGLSGIL